MKNEYDLVAFDVVSIFHVYQVVAWSLSHEEIKRIEIQLQRNMNGEYCVDVNHSVCIGGKHIYFSKKKEYNEKFWGALLGIIVRFPVFIMGRVLKSGNKCFAAHHTYFKPTILLYFSLRSVFRLKSVCFEEGVGTYSSLSKWLYSSRVENKKYPFILYYLRKILSLFCGEKYRVLIGSATNSEIRRFRDAVAKLNQYVIGGDDLLFLGELKRNLGFRGIVLFISSPRVDLNGVSSEDYSLLLTSLKSHYSDFDILVKPHPLEVKSLDIYNNLGLKVASKRISAESVFEIVKPDVVVGEYSGSLIVSANVFNIPTYTVELDSNGRLLLLNPVRPIVG